MAYVVNISMFKIVAFPYTRIFEFPSLIEAEGWIAEWDGGRKYCHYDLYSRIHVLLTVYMIVVI